MVSMESVTALLKSDEYARQVSLINQNFFSSAREYKTDVLRGDETR
jgi:hypothetical protein